MLIDKIVKDTTQPNHFQRGDSHNMNHIIDHLTTNQKTTTNQNKDW